MAKELRKHFLKTITGLLLLSLFASCVSGPGFHKRKYTKGVYVDRLGSVKKPPSQRTYYPVEQYTPSEQVTPTEQHTPQQPVKPVILPDTSNDDQGGGIVMINYQAPLVHRIPPPVIHKDTNTNRPKPAPDTAINNLKSNIKSPPADTTARNTIAYDNSNRTSNNSPHKHKKGYLGILGFILVMSSIFTGLTAFFNGLEFTAAIITALPWLTYFAVALILLATGMILCGMSVHRQEPVMAFGYAGLIIGGLWILFIVGGYLID